MGSFLRTNGGDTNWTLRFGAVLFGAASIMAVAGSVGGMPGLVLGAVLVGGTGTALGHRVDSAHEDVVSNVEAALDESDSAAFDGGFRELDGAFDKRVSENRDLRQRVDELEATLERTTRRNERIESQSERLQEAMQLCAAGQLAHRIDFDEESPLDVADDFNEMMDELEATVRHLKDFITLVVSSSNEVMSGTEEVSEASDQISETIQKIAAGANVQSERLQSVNGEMETLSSSIEEIASLSDEVATLSERTAEVGRQGQEAAKTAIDGLNDMEDGSTEAVEAIETLQSEMEAIDELVEFISDVARETNMLALNANIEATRNSSGDQSGEGFAAVANEVKELAAKSREAAENIEKRIEDVHEKTEVATNTVRETESRVAAHTDSVENALDALDEIAEYAEETNHGVQEMHTAADEQAKSTQQVVALVDETATISDQTSDLAEDVSASAQEQTASLTDVATNTEQLAQNANWLLDTLEMYKARQDVPGMDQQSPTAQVDSPPAATAGAASDTGSPLPGATTPGGAEMSSGSTAEGLASPDDTADEVPSPASETAPETSPDWVTKSNSWPTDESEEFTFGEAADTGGLPTQFQTGMAIDDDSYEAGRRATAQAFDAMDTERVDFCQVFCSPAYEYEAVLEGIRDVIGPDAKLIGASSSGEFTEESVAEGTVTVSLVASDTIEFFTGLGTDLSDGVVGAVNEAIETLPTSVEGYPHLSAINLHDGLAGISDQIAVVTQRNLGHEASFVGGSAGDDLAMEATHVFHDDTIATDSVVIALMASKEPVTIAVGHGHSPISEPVTVTKSEGGTVRELDGRPAFEVWREAVESYLAETDRTIDFDAIEDDSMELLGLLTEFEFGLEEGQGAISDGYKIRWPGLRQKKEGPLDFPVGVPEGTVLRVMHSPPEEQIVSARETANTAIRNAPGEVSGGFVYDCACRSIILGENFDEAVDAMNEELGVPFSGFETYGELCMERGLMSGYHNTTSVVMLLPK
ncbi:FIST N-terminal domain-containing protein [Natrinema halophilum]|uniref:FIST C-terminal domain-containing protein n=1 Tax=Natrinema halophilum TaxID=1699371 RepID=A0A7D5GJB9_9EURY|nr:FIST N-terminal domain-containing protein [Natrinema halophilum]QLG50474.1 methyl-accepting chemotaxis protein [Natrinema halophilum]